ncbi:MAG: translation initiation factor IF-5A [Thermoprotei archaeon]|nr:MAG: translation initiation factor IF-5A [Thermoprotei archaeon]RLF23216.1 MAG: translation initiation factor IF-5A [Thermoprotei archaeon]
MSIKPATAGSIKEGSYIVIDNEPCKVVEVSKSKTGKHGSAKCRIVAVGVFDGVKRSIVVPADATVNVPIIRKLIAQVLSTTPDTVQLMDLSTYEVYEVPIPEDEALKSKIAPGVEVEVWEIMGRRKIMRTR